MRHPRRNVNEVALFDPVAELQIRAVEKLGYAFEHINCRFVGFVKVRFGLRARGISRICMQIAFEPAVSAETPEK